VKRRKKKLLLFSVICGCMVFYAVNAQPIDQYVSVLKNEATGVHSPVDNDDQHSIRQQIEDWKKTHDEAPQDAYLDPIWKAVPGYNGRVVDVEASLLNMKQSGVFSRQQLVYIEQEPKVSLEQLGAQPIYRGNPNKPGISFMVNVAWGNEYLDEMLNTLDKYQVKTTFFLDGSWVRRYPEWAKKIAERGHEIGNHAYSHPDMSKQGATQIRQQIGKTQAVIEKTLGIKPTLFAPPSGAYSQAVVDIATREFQMKTILWTADTVDWKRPPVADMLHRLQSKMGKGVLVLMHPTPTSAKGLEPLIKMAKQRNLTPMTVSELLSSKRIEQP